MNHKKIIYVLIALFAFIYLGQCTYKKFNFNFDQTIGQKIDSLNGVFVFYNGGMDHTTGRNLAIDGYNLGMKYQCVEFVKRYYYQYLNHKMPDSYGNAKDFFDKTLADGQVNEKRNLLQFQNNSSQQPQVNDLLIFDGTVFNIYGHVAIVSKVTDTKIEIIQQNPGPFGKSRLILELQHQQNKWRINNNRILGWLRMQ